MKKLMSSAAAMMLCAVSANAAVISYDIASSDERGRLVTGFALTIDTERLGFELSNVTISVSGVFGAPEDVEFVDTVSGDQIGSISLFEQNEYYFVERDGPTAEQTAEFEAEVAAGTYDPDGFFAQNFGSLSNLSVRAFDFFDYSIFLDENSVATSYIYDEGGNVDILATPMSCIRDINNGPDQTCLAAREVTTTFLSGGDPVDVAPIPLPATGILLGIGLFGLGFARRQSEATRS